MNSLLRHCTLACAALLGLCAPLAQAACNGADIAATTPDARFKSGTDGITDSATGLVWKRCPEGLGGTACTVGSAMTGTWAEALARTAAVNAASATLGDGQNDWRLPNRNELASLVERKCVAPALNTTIFQGSAAQSYWSSSSYSLNASLAWYVDFNAGDVAAAPKSGAKFIRLVRAGN